MQLELILSSLLLPLILSLTLILTWSSLPGQSDRKGGWKNGLCLLLAYLPSYLWIAGIPSLPPAQALGWIGFIGVGSLAVIAVINLPESGPGKRLIVLFSIFSVSIIMLSRPILQHSFSLLLAVELTVFLAAWVGLGLLVLQPTGNKSIPLSITGTGFALAAVLGGSLLIGQLTGALAAALGGFALYELISRKKRPLNAEASLVSVSLLGGIVLVGWQYAEIPSLPLISIFVGSVAGLFMFKKRGRGWRFIALKNALAMSIPMFFGLAWLVMTSDNSGY